MAWGEETSISEHLKPLVAKTTSPYRAELERLYVQRDNEPIWVTPEGIQPRGHDLKNLLIHANRQGLDPQDYDQSEIYWLARSFTLFGKDRKNLRVSLLARYELVLSKNLLKYLDHSTGGRISPTLINGKWYLKDHRPPLLRLFWKAAEGNFSTTLESLADGHYGFAPLVRMLDRYRRIESEGGWPTIPNGALLAMGMKGNRVQLLQKRLALTGDLALESSNGVFDERMTEAVKRFQARHGLSVDGLAGPKTLAFMNVSVHSRIQQILVNLERVRWMPQTLGTEYVVVNIPDFQLTAFRDKKVSLAMPVIVGKPMSQTPIFSDRIEYVVFNPYWYVPRSIAAEEIYPQFEKDPYYLQTKNFEVVDPGNKPVEMTRLTIENIQNQSVRIRQRPGPTNALGLVKFMFPNDHAIYLHDTPADHLFDAVERDFSHGCIRVERPYDLANFLLNEMAEGRDSLPLESDFARKEVPLPKPMSVYILYLTTWVAEDGTLQFRDDIYGHDKRLWAALHPILSDTVSKTGSSVGNSANRDRI